MACFHLSRYFATVCFAVLTLPIIAGCDAHVIYPWDPGGGKQSRSETGQAEKTKEIAPPPVKIASLPSYQKTNQCRPANKPASEILLNKKNWAGGMDVFFNEPSSNRDGSPLKGLKSVSIYYHIEQKGSLGAPLLVTNIKAKSKEGGKKNGRLIPFSQLEDLQRHLRRREVVQTVFCSRAVNSAGPGKMSPSIAVQFRRDKGWMPPP